MNLLHTPLDSDNGLTVMYNDSIEYIVDLGEDIEVWAISEMDRHLSVPIRGIKSFGVFVGIELLSKIPLSQTDLAYLIMAPAIFLSDEEAGVIRRIS